MQYESQYYGVVDFNGPYLMHHGIKGQKWGVRRFQNPDGSLTEAGKKRYYTSDGRLTDKGKRLYDKERKSLDKLKDSQKIYDAGNKFANKFGKNDPDLDDISGAANVFFSRGKISNSDYHLAKKTINSVVESVTKDKELQKKKEALTKAYTAYYKYEISNNLDWHSDDSTLQQLKKKAIEASHAYSDAAVASVNKYLKQKGATKMAQVRGGDEHTGRDLDIDKVLGRYVSEKVESDVIDEAFEKLAKKK